MIYSDKGKVEWRLLAKKAQYYQNGDKAYPEGICLEFYDAEQNITITASAQSAYYFSEEDLYQFTGDVEVRNSNNHQQLNTEEIQWNPQTETFRTNKFVRIENKCELLTGEGLVAKKDLSHYEILAPQGVMYVKSLKEKL